MHKRNACQQTARDCIMQVSMAERRFNRKLDRCVYFNVKHCRCLRLSKSCQLLLFTAREYGTQQRNIIIDDR